MKQLGILFMIIVFITQSCKVGNYKSYKNEKIDKVTRAQIKELNDKLFKGIITNNVAAVKALMSDQLLEQFGKDGDKLIELINTYFKASGYRLLDEYYVKNSTTGIENSIRSNTSNESDYIVHYIALNEEMYISLMLPDEQNQGYLITAIYGKYDCGWKLNILSSGQYSIYEKTAPYYFDMAKKCYDKSYLVDAVNYMSLAEMCLSPAPGFWQYPQELEMLAFQKKVVSEANAKFQSPITLENIESKPIVFAIYPEFLADGIYPVVLYFTITDLHDSIALKKEYEQIREEVNKIFPGINVGKKAVIYKAFNEMPNEKNIDSIISFGFVDTNTK